MTNLKELDASWNSGIDQMGIQGLDLIKLNTWNNLKIRDVSWMFNLKELNAAADSGIDQIGIKGLNLIKLFVRSNKKIKDVSWMKNLKQLDVSGGSCAIDQSGIIGLDWI